MTSLRIAALLLILLGGLALAYPVITYATTETVVDVGPLEVTRQDEHRIPLTPFVGGAAVAIGIGLLFTGRRRQP